MRASAGAASFRRQPTVEKRLAEAQAGLAAVEADALAESEDRSPRQQAAQERAAREKAARLEAALAELPVVREAKPADQQAEPASPPPTIAPGS